MKVIQNGAVFDLDRYDHVCDLEPTSERNEVFNTVSVSHALRRDKANGRFYVYSVGEDIYPNVRNRVGIAVVSEDVAKTLAAARLSYDRYVKVFPDPEGSAAGAERKVDELTSKMAALEDSKKYWMNESAEKTDRISELEAAVRALKGENDALKAEAEANVEARAEARAEAGKDAIQ